MKSIIRQSKLYDILIEKHEIALNNMIEQFNKLIETEYLAKSYDYCTLCIKFDSKQIAHLFISELEYDEWIVKEFILNDNNIMTITLSI